MIDIDDSLRKAGAFAGIWTADAALELAHGLERSGAAVTVDWDKGAGEAWIRVIKGDHVVALISTTLPFAFVVSDLGTTGQQREYFSIVEVANMDEAALRAGRRTLSEAFGASARLDALDTNGFSAHDLWYVTV